MKIVNARMGALFLLGLVALLVSACGPVHIDPRWASLSAVPETGQVVLAFGDHLTLIDATDGKPVELLDAEGDVRTDEQGNPRIWEVRATDNQQTRFYSAPVVIDSDTLLAASYDRRLLEIDVPVARIDGQVATVDPNQHIIASPVVDGEFVYVGLSDRGLVALNAADFSEAWRVSTNYGVWAQPLVVENTLYFTSMDHFIYAVDKINGEVLWKTDLEGAVTATPIYHEGLLYVGSFSHKMYALDSQTGEIVNSYQASEWIWSSPVLYNGTLYFADMRGMVYALNLDDFTEVWKTQAATRSIVPTPLVTEEFVVVGSRDQKVYWLNRETGEVSDTKDVAGEVLANLLLIEPSETVDIPEPLVIVNTSATQELLVAFTLERGQREWVYGR